MAKRTTFPAGPLPVEQQPPAEPSPQAESAPPPPAAPDDGLREPQAIDWIALEGLPAFKARVWLNHPWKVRQDLISGDDARFRPAFARVVLEHNGWRDADGEPYPPASDSAAFWDALSNPLASVLMRSVYAEARRLANFPPPTPAT